MARALNLRVRMNTRPLILLSVTAVGTAIYAFLCALVDDVDWPSLSAGETKSLLGEFLPVLVGHLRGSGRCMNTVGARAERRATRLGLPPSRIGLRDTPVRRRRHALRDRPRCPGVA